MDEEHQVEKARRIWRLRMALMIVGLLAIVGLSLWIRTGHNSALLAGATVLLLFAIGFFTQKTGDARAGQDPAFAKGYTPAAQAIMPLRMLSNTKFLLFVAILLIVPVAWGLLHLAQLIPPLKQLLVGATVQKIIALSFVISLSLVGGLYLLGKRWLNGSRSSPPDRGDPG